MQLIQSLFRSLFRSLVLLDFYGERHLFYLDLQRATRKTELLRDFLLGELAIATAKGTRNPSRAFALREMAQRILDGSQSLPSRIIGDTMPAGDRFMLAGFDDLNPTQQLAVLGEISKTIQFQSESKNIIAKALIVPLVALPFLFFFAYTLSAKLIPEIAKSAPPSVWTPFNSLVRDVTFWINQYGTLALFAAAGGAGLLMYSLPRWTSPLRLAMESTPPLWALLLSPFAPWLFPLVMYRDFQALTLLTTLSFLLGTGRTVKDALQTIARSASPYLRHHLLRISARIDRHPDQLASAFDGGILSPYTLARMKTFARTSVRYEDVLIGIGTEGAVDLQNQVKSSAGQLNALFLTLAAGFTLFLVLGQMSITNEFANQANPLSIKAAKMKKEQAYP